MAVLGGLDTVVQSDLPLSLGRPSAIADVVDTLTVPVAAGGGFVVALGG